MGWVTPETQYFVIPRVFLHLYIKPIKFICITVITLVYEYYYH